MNNSTTAIEFTLNGKVLRGLTAGDMNDEQLPVILCLHGWLDNAASFTEMLPVLAKSSRVVAIDWFGHGHSDHRSDDAQYHFVDWVYDLALLLEQTNWQQVHIVGHSMGAMVASAYVAAYPEKITSLTMIDAFGFLTLDEAETTVQLRKGLQSRLLAERKLAAVKSKQKVSAYKNLAAAIEARAAVADFDKNVASLLVERGSIETEQGVVWRADLRVRNVSPYRWTLKQAQQVMADINVPTQLIHGTNGMDMVQKGLTAFSLGTDQFEECTIDGGHHVHMEQPIKTAEVVVTFINKCIYS